MILHKTKESDPEIYTLFDQDERVAVYPTRYLEFLRRNKRPVKSQYQIANAIKLHCQWLENSPFFNGLTIDESLANTFSDDILDWINDQRNAGLSENTINNREVLVRNMYEYFTTDEGKLRNDIPWSRSNFTRRQNKRIPRFLTAQQLIKLLNGMYHESQRVAAHFMYDTGVRTSELTEVKCRQLPDERDYPEEVNYYPITILGNKAYDGNTYKIRDTIISRPMLARIRRYHATVSYKLAKNWKLNDPNKPVFLNVFGEELSKSSVYKNIKAAWKRQGGDLSEVSPHRLRHGTAYSVLQSELGKELLDNLLILKGMLGHENIKTTEIYSSIPIIAARGLCQKKNVKFRFEEADEIYQKTYLPAYKNNRKLGTHK